MAQLTKGSIAPDFSLSDFKLSEVLKDKSILLTFYKKTCPTCQFSYPFFEKLHQYYSGPIFNVIGIGQDPETKEFSKMYGITFPMISDTTTYDVSKKYDLLYVPTTFLVTQSQKIKFKTEGFSKKDFLELSKCIGDCVKKSPLDLFKGIDVPELKPG